MKLQFLVPVMFIVLVLSIVLVTALDDGKSGKANRLTRTVNEKILEVNEKIAKVNVEDLKQKVPTTYELTEKELEVAPIIKKFLLWTDDGNHIMWGRLGNGYFTGKDDLGKSVWGIYGKHVFAGFYDGEFFWGRYKGGFWKATGLFGLEKAQGAYIIFPNVHPDLITEDVNG